jgi:pilus assembly protein CpaB
MRRPTVFLLLAAVVGILAAIIVYSALRGKQAQIEAALRNSVEIVVAARDLSLGTKLDLSAVKSTRWPKDSVPEDAVKDPRACIGTIAKASIPKNDPIVRSKLFSGDKASGILPLMIPVGMRAVSVQVDEVADISGFVAPGSRVDVLVALSEGNTSRSKIVLENVEVLAAAQTIEQRNDKPEVVKVVTMLVTPEESEHLALATKEGTLRLAMRGYNDKKVVLTGGSDVGKVLRAYSFAAPVPTMVKQHVVASAPIRRILKVEVIRSGGSGVSGETLEFAKGGQKKAPGALEFASPSPPASDGNAGTKPSPEEKRSETGRAP